jgi:hypothetical protein
VAKFGTIPYFISGGNSIKLKNAQLIQTNLKLCGDFPQGIITVQH